MAVITENIINDLLDYLEKSIQNLAKDTFENLEFDGGFEGKNNFLQNQFDIRMENMLIAKQTSLHHLESGMKNKIIQRKQKLFYELSKQYSD